MIKVAQSVPMPLGKGTAFFTTPKHVPGPSQGSRGGADGRRGMQWRDEGHGGAAMDEAEDAADGCETGGCGVGSSGELETLQIRVGIHTGPIAASTLGFKRNCLTLVGDTLVSGGGVLSHATSE